ncbi:hypothetical protein TI39_contig55g00005 [Zymoseptoria brevis]|uniref:Uncharacterized protein n=1 Tax=Zymoseptoria brevis TaxID=1047168 RepID=A0A0F4H1J2_9PEZI|nr:hypothetical protein TI39_contig55g00005 [Zymoseptoria brevis]
MSCLPCFRTNTRLGCLLSSWCDASRAYAVRQRHSTTARQWRPYTSDDGKLRAFKQGNGGTERRKSAQRPSGFERFLREGDKEDTRDSKPTDHPGEFYDESGNTNKTKFYDFFLKHIKTKPAKWDDPGDWLGRIHVDTGLLSPTLQDRPLDYFASDSRDLPMAQRCLEHFITLTARGRSKNEQRRQYCNKQNLPGSRALVWLFRDYDSADLSINFGFLKALVHCMVAEGAESHLWYWLKIPHIPTVLSTQEGRDTIAWRGPMLRFLVESQVYSAEGADGINAALRSFEYTWSFDLPFRARREEQSPLVITKKLAGV